MRKGQERKKRMKKRKGKKGKKKKRGRKGEKGRRKRRGPANLHFLATPLFGRKKQL